MRTLKLLLLAFIFLLTANVAHPLGVGDIKINSALNEPLDAEIGLFALRPGEVGNVRVAMATPAEFARAGIDRPLVLSYLRFTIEEHADGSALIRVSSKKAIKEPFLDFLLEVNWSSGRILREYTLLLDPPVFAERKAAPVAVAKTVPAETTPAARAPATPAAPAASTAPAAGGDDLFPRIDIGGEATAPSVTATAAADVMTSADEYKTHGNDTLWSVAERLRPTDVTTQQMMMALLAANPDAFANNNINGLKSGQVLRIPDHAALLALSQHDALRAVREQHAAWQQARGDLISAPTSKGTAESSTASTGKIDEGASRPEVKLVTPKAGESTAAADGSGKDLDALRQELALVNEQLASKSQQNSEMEARLQELQDQIQTMERLLALKNQSLEELQNKLTEQPAPVAPTVPVVEEPAKPVEPAVEPAQPVVTPPTMKDGKPYNPYALTEVPKVTPEPVKKPTVKPAPVAKPQAEKGIADTILGLLDDPSLLAVIGGVVLLLLALVWIVIRRRRVSSMGFPESILTERGASTTVTQNKELEETSMLSDFTSTSMGSTLEEAGEVDPLAEADVYLAYNKYHQAEELLSGAIDNEPDRIDLKVKLLEVYASSRNADAFAELAEDVHGKIDDTSTALWDKVVSMGRDLCPGNPLFGTEAGESVLSIADLDEQATTEGGDLEFDLGDLSLESHAPETDVTKQAAVEESDELSLDMGEIESMDFDTGAVSPEVADELSDLELDSFALDETTEPEAEQAAPVAVEEQPAETAESGLDFGDIDLDALDAELAGGDTAHMERPEPAADLEPAGEESAIGLDEVATKLDLAKAYIDMGDPDGARSILDEVLNEGNDGQKQEAQELLQQL